MSRLASRLALTALVLALATATAQGAATFVITNGDAAGVGFNDPTPAAPVGGNPGTTIGEQRLNAFVHAANIWGANLTSTVTINVLATWEPLTCTATSAVLGSCGPLNAFADFPNALFTSTWFHVALANRLAGIDIDPGVSDMRARFNINLGNAGCLTGTGWYYGFDANEGTQIDFVAVLLHEMGHGLGFSTFTSGLSGEYCCPDPDPQLPTAYDHLLLDETTGLLWSDPTETIANRQAGAISMTNLTWTGPNVTANIPSFLGRQPRLIVTAPAPAVGSYPVGTAAFGTQLSDPGLVGQTIVAATDTGGVSADDGCEAITNGAAVAGNIALVNRGNCTFLIKAQNCQAAGAIGMVVVNNAAGVIGMSGTDPTVTLVAAMVDQTQGNLIRANLPATADLGLNTMPRAGTNAGGRVMMYTPSTFAAGSSVSHWDTSAFPNLLMEPAINSDLNHTLDLTLEQMRDIGWFGTVPVELMRFEVE